MNIHRSALLLPLAMCLTSPARSAEFTVQTDDKGVTVKLGDQLFTRYVFQWGNTPILWPIIGPTGAEVTRGYPMRPASPDEKADHTHHRSLWFNHGEVNGVSFWDEGSRHGSIKHVELVQAQGGSQAVIVTRNDWVDADGQKICTDLRRLTLGASADWRWIDFDVTVAAGDTPVKFGDTKEGSFGIRVAGTMDVDAKRGGKIVNSLGQTDDDAWGKTASWVDYYGPVDGQVVGIAIMNHPSSFRFPTYWHVPRTASLPLTPLGHTTSRTPTRWMGPTLLCQGVPCRSDIGCCCTKATKRKDTWRMPTANTPKRSRSLSPQ